MSGYAAGRLLDRIDTSRETLLWLLLVVNTELLLLGLFWLVSGVRLSDPLAVRYWLYPFVWVNVGAAAVLKTRVASAPRRTRSVAGILAVGYFLLLGYFGGVFGLAAPGPSTLRVATDIPPGWGPAVLYNGRFLAANLLPFKVVGYAALAYLVFATVVDASGSAVTGILGLLSCVSCTWPIAVTILTSVFGGGAALATAVYSQSYELSTAVFVATVVLLYYRPFGRAA